MIERIYTLSYYHNQIGSMNYYPLFRVRSWNNSMRCMSLYILIDVIEIECWYTPYVWKKHHVNCPHFNINVSKISFCWSYTRTETKCAACMTRIIMSKGNGLWKGIWFRHWRCFREKCHENWLLETPSMTTTGKHGMTPMYWFNFDGQNSSQYTLGISLLTCSLRN